MLDSDCLPFCRTTVSMAYQFVYQYRSPERRATTADYQAVLRNRLTGLIQTRANGLDTGRRRRRRLGATCGRLAVDDRHCELAER